MAYYYLVASLPAVGLDQPVPVTCEEFLASCEGQLTPGDQRDLREIAAGRPERGRHRFLRRWRETENGLRHALAGLRAKKTGHGPRTSAPPPEGLDLFLGLSVKAAMALETPLERELALDRLRLELLDDLSRDDPFGASVLFGFAVRLRLAERWQRLSDADGRKSLGNLVGTLARLS